MKYLIFLFLLILGSSTLVAQDTLYVKGERSALIVEINVIKKKKLSYFLVGTDRLKTISLKKVRKIKFSADTLVEQENEVQEQQELVVRKEEFRSTVLAQSGGLINQTQAGLNYMHRLSPAITEKVSYWVHAGGGYHAQRSLQRETTGSYIEIGMLVELANRKYPENRLHIGVDVNHQWVKGREFIDRNIFLSGRVEEIDDNRIAIQIPIGYTHRGDKGFYFSSGLEFSTHKLFPAFNCRFGYCFGK